MPPASSKRSPRRRAALGVLTLGLALLLGYGWLQRQADDGRRAANEPADGVGSPAGELVEGGTPPASEAPPGTEGRTSEPETEGAGAPAAGEDDGSQTMRVLVLDELDGKPIGDARVTLFDRPSPVPRRTGADGRCQVPYLDREQRSRLEVEAPGYFHARVEGNPSEFVRLALAPATRLEGRVRAADTGEPVAGATLTLAHDACSDCAPERVATDAEGRYELAALALGRPLELRIEAEGFAPTRRTFRLLERRARTTQDLALLRGIELEGRVEDWASGLGLAGARVGELVADAQGHFRGRFLPRGASTHASLRVEAPGHATLEARLELATPGTRLFRLPELAYLEGRVFGPDGEPCEGASVERTRAEPNRAPGRVAPSPLDDLPEGQAFTLALEPARSDGEGRYRLALLPWAEDVGFLAEKPGYTAQEGFLGRIGPPGSSLRLDWWLRPDEPGTIVRGVVTLNGQSLANPSGMVTWTGPTRSGGQALGKEPFELWVEPGEVRLAASLTLLRSEPPSELVCRLRPDETRWVEFDVVAPQRPIAGTVRFRDGTPARAFPLFADCELEPGLPAGDRLTARATTDEEGRYELSVTDLGYLWRVWPVSPVGRPAIREARPGAQGLDFTLADAYRLRLRVREGTSGATLALGEDVLLTRRSERGGFVGLKPVEGSADAEGWSELWVATPEVDLAALPLAPELARHAPALRLGVRLALVGSEPVELVLRPGLEASVELAEDQEPWPADARLYLIEDELWSSVHGFPGDANLPAGWLAEHRTLQFDPQGRARLVGLAPGPARLASDDRRFRVEPGFPSLAAHEPPIRMTWSRPD